MMAHNSMHRYAKAVRIKPEMIAEYKRLHTKVWHDVTDALSQAGISNYSIFVVDDLAFEYLEYSGEDFENDMGIFSSHPEIIRWEEVCDKCCLLPITNNPDFELWTSMEEVFHLD
ncbi:MAG: L-rhamnose mutarotase [Planktomarina sp.]|nr:L-rhamnose mutarotase [Planktomarina sp.]